MDLNIIHNEDCRSGLQRYPDGFFYCCVTSPPYWGLRDYGVAGQLGLEETPEEYVAGMVDVFRQVKRVLRDDGTLWVNIGDSYASSVMSPHNGQRANRNQDAMTGIRKRPSGDLKTKDLVGIPWMLAFALRADGWYWRDTMIWHKPNPMPESVKDRTTKAHEYILLFSKSHKYYFDVEAIKEPMAASSIQRLSQNIDQQNGSLRVPGKTNGPMKAVQAKGNRRTFRGGGVYTSSKSFDNSAAAQNDSAGNIPNDSGLRNKRSVWTIATHGFKEAHFATFPEELPHTCILAGCPDGGNVLDPFMGAGTTGLVARKLQRNYVGFELNKEYVAMAERRLRNELGMFL